MTTPAAAGDFGSYRPELNAALALSLAMPEFDESLPPAVNIDFASLCSQIFTQDAGVMEKSLAQGPRGRPKLRSRDCCRCTRSC